MSDLHVPFYPQLFLSPAVSGETAVEDPVAEVAGGQRQILPWGGDLGMEASLVYHTVELDLSLTVGGLFGKVQGQMEVNPATCLPFRESTLGSETMENQEMNFRE